MQPPARRRFTIVELLVVSALVGLLALITIPVLRGSGIDEAEAEATRRVQDAVRRYQFDTGAYPTAAPPPLSEGQAVEPWQPGSLPTARSLPRFAAIAFDAAAVKRSGGQTVRLYPDYLAERPKYAEDFAADGLPRWRIDHEGDVTVELDGRSY